MWEPKLGFQMDTQSESLARTVLEHLQLQCLSGKPIKVRKCHSTSPLGAWDTQQNAVLDCTGPAMGCSGEEPKTREGIQCFVGGNEYLKIES